MKRLLTCETLRKFYEEGMFTSQYIKEVELKIRGFMGKSLKDALTDIYFHSDFKATCNKIF